ncbi:MAG: S-methyl-5-thioribose kinase [Desulfobacteraceae bacterium]|nr:S-methyl-5-thioribose kinase [Desulfobacteraceae bacterium]
MAYQPLNSKSIIDYVKNRPALKNILPAHSNLVAKEIGDGNLNLVFIIENPNKPEQSAVLKQALPYLRVAGESWPLTRERTHFETQALLKYNELAPGLAPVVYDYDEEMSLVVIEYLREHEIMRKGLVARKRYPHFADHISTFLANSLFYTSDLYLTGVEKKLLMAKFVNEQLRKLQEDFVYTNPYMESEENNWNPLVDAEVQAVRANAELKMAIAEMKDAYMNHSEALIHADLHTGSIMLNERDTRVIDPEFAFFGPIAYDVGAVLQNLVLNYLSHYGHTPDKKERKTYQEYILEMICDIWNQFAQKFDETWAANNRGELVPTKYWDFPGGKEAFAEYRRRYIHKLLQETAGHGGVKFLRRMMGIVNVWDISSIKDPEKRAIAERLSIRIGSRWVLERKQINSVEDLTGIVREETKDVKL